MPKFRPKQAVKQLCATAESRRYGVNGWQVFDSTTREILGLGQCATSAWHLAYYELTRRIPASDVLEGISWWNGLDDEERAEWLERGGNTGTVADAWAAYKNYDPTPWCNACGAKTQDKCKCPPIADNE